MDSTEGVSLAKMAVSVLLVVLVIGAVVAIVYAAYSWFTSGTDKLSDQVVSIDKSAFSQYDDQQVSGTDVLSALKTYRESDIAIFIANSKNQGTGGFASVPSGTVTCYNYCALVTNAELKEAGGDDAGTGYEITLTYATEESKTEGGLANCFTFDGFQYGEDSAIDVKHNTNFSPTTTKGYSANFVKQSGKWYANLVYDDTTGDIGGIIFRQMN